LSVTLRVVLISGQPVLISGQPVTTSVSGNVVSIASGIPVGISGQAVTVSGNAVTVSGNAVTVSGNAVTISGNTVVLTSGAYISVSGNVVTAVIFPTTTFLTSAFIIAMTSGGTTLPSIAAKMVTLRAHPANSGVMWVGPAGSPASGVGWYMEPGDALDETNVSGLNIYGAYALVSGDRLMYAVWA
jgi:hypothetical protein